MKKMFLLYIASGMARCYNFVGCSKWEMIAVRITDLFMKKIETIVNLSTGIVMESHPAGQASLCVDRAS